MFRGGYVSCPTLQLTGQAISAPIARCAIQRQVPTHGGRSFFSEAATQGSSCAEGLPRPRRAEGIANPVATALATPTTGRPFAANLSSVPARKSCDKCADQPITATKLTVGPHDRTPILGLAWLTSSRRRPGAGHRDEMVAPLRVADDGAGVLSRNLTNSITARRKVIDSQQRHGSCWQCHGTLQGENDALPAYSAWFVHRSSGDQRGRVRGLGHPPSGAGRPGARRDRCPRGNRGETGAAPQIGCPMRREPREPRMRS